MLLDFATNPRGTTYAYFVCSGRAAKKTNCTRRAVPVAVAERLVADSYVSITIGDATVFNGARLTWMRRSISATRVRIRKSLI